MNYRRLGNTGLKVSEISLGSWLTYGDSVEKERAVKTIEQAYDVGINFFDTANVYNRGESEKVVGDALRQYRRDSYVLATKVFGAMGEGPNDRGLSRKHVFEQLHASLDRLGTDYVDIYYCHRYDPNTPVEETLRTIDDLIRQGKILYAGVSEWTAAQIEEAVRIADQKLLDRIVVNQPVYNMLNRYIEEEVIPVCEKYGIGQVVFSPLAQGVLTGKYKKGQEAPEGSRATNEEQRKYIERFLNDEMLEKVDQLETIAAEQGIALSQMALSWILRNKNISSAIIGASRPEQVVENVQGSEIELSDEVVNRIDLILKGQAD
ncbi:aldo/keto reductase family protein [Evansella clarkii]|jgi:voltage-dependent potassium channel beta subunit|uniref:aldo/keto reductase family protein n=1 Tax=Evansella clarkii TaxID=79879 RepID=UPI000998CA66|nr:aldo/keto reductase family protein [Evansella clarkii]